MSIWIVRAADETDLNAIIAIEARAFGAASWGAESLRSGMTAPYVTALVAHEPERPVEGFALWRRLGEEGEILSIAVDTPVRGRGMAKALLAEIIVAAEALKLSALFLEVDAGNAPALALYRKAHFADVGRRQRYYRNGADALVLRRAV